MALKVKSNHIVFYFSDKDRYNDAKKHADVSGSRYMSYLQFCETAIDVPRNSIIKNRDTLESMMDRMHKKDDGSGLIRRTENMF